MRYVVYGSLALAFVLVLGHAPDRAAEWFGERSVLLAQNTGLEKELATEVAFRRKVQAGARAAAAQYRHRAQTTVAPTHARAIAAVASAPPDCRGVVQAVTADRDTTLAQLRTLQRMHDADLWLIQSYQREDSLQTITRQAAVHLLTTVPIVHSWWSRLLHPQVTAGFTPVTYTLDDQRMHLGALSVTLGYPL